MSRTTRAARVVLLALILAPAWTHGQVEVPARPEPQPYRKGAQEPLDFRGPGREEPEPDVSEVVLGWFGRLVPRALAPSEAACGQRGLVSFAGEGRVLIASA